MPDTRDHDAWAARRLSAPLTRHDSAPLEATIDALEVSAYKVPTDSRESDGTAEWDATTIVVVEARGGGRTGLGWTYGDVSCATVIGSTLREVVIGARRPARDGGVAGDGRGVSQPGASRSGVDGDRGSRHGTLGSQGEDAWSLPLAALLDAAHEAVPVYGSGGFTSYSDERLADQLGGWAAAGDPAGEDEGRPRPGPRSRSGCAWPARRSVPTPSCTSMPTAR